ncbi:MAG: transposase [Acidobacteria bacterium]|nr:transposase [Acidobacteriota bacterium]
MDTNGVELRYEANGNWEAETQHGMLAEAYEFAKKCGLFKVMEGLGYEMKTVVYSPVDKLKTLWASVMVGCEHTVEINEQFGEHEARLAEVFGLKRFPDQSQVNRVLTATTLDQVERWREGHLKLLVANSRAKDEGLWWKAATGERFLMVDIDQRGIVVSGKEYEVAEPGFFGSKRGHRGYQLTLMWFGGGIGEVVDEYLDGGKTPMRDRLPDVLQTLSEVCQKLGIAPGQVIIRADAQLGTPWSISQIRRFGFHYILKGLTPKRAQVLAETATGVYWRVKPNAEGSPRWLCDLGDITHRDCSQTDHQGTLVTSRTLSLVYRTHLPHPPEPGSISRSHTRPHAPTLHYAYLLTDLTPAQLPIQQVLFVYDDRATIERYFADEQYALGAKHIRTHHFAGAALFQFLVATTNNVLRWFKHLLFAGSTFARLGLLRLIRQVINLPARLFHHGHQWLVQFPASHALARKLIAACPHFSQPLSFATSESCLHKI